MDPTNKQALTETVKQFLRYVYFGLIGLVVTFLTSLLASGSLNSVHVTVAGQPFNLGFLITAGVGGVVTLLDHYVHNNDNIDSNGLAPDILQK